MSSAPHHEVHKLYNIHHGWLVEWLRRRLGCVHHAHDLAQDTFVRVLDKPLVVQGVHEPRAFLSRIAHGLMVDQFRRRAIEQAYLEALQHLPTRHMESAEERMMNIEALMRIDAMFAGLNPNIRTAFLLSRLHGMTYPDIARQMNVSLRSVEGYMAKAIGHLLANARQDTLG